MIYFDNASTSYPKPDIVKKGVTELINSSTGSSMRTASTEKTDIIFETRQKIANLLNIKFPTSIIFTSNATDSLNTIIDGFLKEGDHVISTAIEHNSVVRPLIRLRKERKIQTTWVKCDKNGYIDPDEILNSITNKTRLVIVNHASNVTGAVQDVEKIGSALEKYPNIKFLLDASQSIGHIPIDNQKIKADFIAFTGHKALNGITGVGGFYINPEVEIRSFKVGGTGVLSELLVQPKGIPLQYEAGTMNTIGIGSLSYGIDYLNNIGITQISTDLLQKTKTIINKLSSLEHVIVYSKPNPIGIVSFNIESIIPSRLSTFLAENADINTRAGIICAPFIHEFLNTNPFGCVRVSLSRFNTYNEIDSFIDYITTIISNINDIRNIKTPNIYSSPSIYDYND